MSDLSPSFITLDQGLNLQVPKIAAPPGTILNMLNYEQVDFQGQKRIDGYVRYDGSLGSYQDVFYRLELDGGDYSVGDSVFNGSQLVGVVAGVQDGLVILAVLDQNYTPTAGDNLSIGSVAGAEEIADAMLPEEQYSTILEANQSLRERTTELPGPVAGLHWFNDRLYAVASVSKVEANGVYYPNDEYQGHTVLAVDGDYIYVGALIEDGVGSDIASLYQSRTEQQALDELGDASLYGWDFVHQGWEVPFEEGYAQYGNLTSLNQNRSGVGITGPTNTAGNNGSAINVLQRVEITNKQDQVNGWKTSTDISSYSLNPDAIRTDDAAYIYADAFFSWDGPTGAVTAAGITTPSLVEYPATNTVEVEV